MPKIVANCSNALSFRALAVNNLKGLLKSRLLLLLLIIVQSLKKSMWHNVSSVCREGEGDDTINSITLYTKSNRLFF